MIYCVYAHCYRNGLLSKLPRTITESIFCSRKSIVTTKRCISSSSTKNNECKVGLLRLVDFMRINDQIQNGLCLFHPLKLDYKSCTTNHEIKVLKENTNANNNSNNNDIRNGTTNNNTIEDQNKINHNNIGSGNFRSLMVRYLAPSIDQLHLPQLESSSNNANNRMAKKHVSLSTYLAMLDEVTTYALIIADPKQTDAVGKPGVTITMRNEWNPNYTPPSYCDHQNDGGALDVTIHSSATKVGGKLGFVNATVYDTKSGQPICHNSQIKYLPSAMKISDFLLTTPIGFRLLKLYVNYFAGTRINAEQKKMQTYRLGKKEEVNTKTKSKNGDNSSPSAFYNENTLLQDIFHSLQFNDEEGSAIFEIEPIHNNGWGGFHGGCQAMLMEIVGTYYAKKAAFITTDITDQESSNELLCLQSIQLEYLSAIPPKKEKVVLLNIEIVSQSTSSLSMNVRLYSIKNRQKIVTQGSLLFSKKAKHSDGIGSAAKKI